jgi:phosphoribosylformylglycinamidine synthase (EC 6.3.5.3)
MEILQTILQCSTLTIVATLPKTNPHNPNGSELATAGVANDSGRVTIMMPHPERVFRAVQHSHHPKDWDERSPWMRMFENSRAWVD